MDEFLRINGVDEEVSKYRLLHSLTTLQKIYGTAAQVRLCSSFMGSEVYKETLEEVKHVIEEKGLQDELLATVPEHRRIMREPTTYSMHEIACTQFMYKTGCRIKIGPSTEQTYDRLMQKMGMPIRFAYILDAYALATKSDDIVVHYLPSSKGPNNGQRIYLEQDESIVRAKLVQGNESALRYFCKIAAASGAVQGKRTLTVEEINSMKHKTLKRETTNLVLENIIRPYKEATK